ncbi:MAG TPA: hypothetical protein VLT16_08320 [Candidatus Limnocylindrales bacterium]|nr:hypothetical protein [Candidatus Limnocylindrales bacterium]
MPLEIKDSVWITMMHELQSFVRQNLEQPETMAEVRQLMAPVNPARPMRHGATEFIRAFELLAPAMMVDFLAENPEILNKIALRWWAKEREELHDVPVRLQA